MLLKHLGSEDYPGGTLPQFVSFLQEKYSSELNVVALIVVQTPFLPLPPPTQVTRHLSVCGGGGRECGVIVRCNILFSDPGTW